MQEMNPANDARQVIDADRSEAYSEALTDIKYGLMLL